MSTDLQKGKMGLCQKLTGCDGPFLMPCGSKSDNEKYCERWKNVPLFRKDIIGKGDNIQVTDEVFKRIKKEFLAKIEKGI